MKTQRVLLASAFAVVTPIVLASCSPSPSPARTGPRITSYAKLHDLGVLLRDYKQANGKFPDALATLVPSYIGSNDVHRFIPPPEFVQQSIHSNASPTMFPAFAYLGQNNAAGVVAYEVTNLWKNTVEKSDSVAVLFSDFHVQYLSIIELRALLTTNR